MICSKNSKCVSQLFQSGRRAVRTGQFLQGMRWRAIGNFWGKESQDLTFYFLQVLSGFCIVLGKGSNVDIEQAIDYMRWELNYTQNLSEYMTCSGHSIIVNPFLLTFLCCYPYPEILSCSWNSLLWHTPFFKVRIVRMFFLFLLQAYIVSRTISRNSIFTYLYVTHRVQCKTLFPIIENTLIEWINLWIDLFFFGKIYSRMCNSGALAR